MGDRKLFGTDGVRGTANIYPMTCELAIALGRAVTYHFQKKIKTGKRPLIIVGKDTRRSCYMFEQAFSAGVCSQGGRVILTGPLPTPGVAFVTTSMRADAGVVISASHNNYSDNGIKIFDGNGKKLPDSDELELEEMTLNPELIPVQIGEDLGSASRLDEVMGRYLVHVKSAFSQKYDMEGMRVVIDCANGASYKTAPMIFSELGAEVIPLAVNPNGVNINDGCGSLFPEHCRDHVFKFRADIGICLDGDADRVAIIDDVGTILPGDQLIGLLVKFLFDKGELLKGDVVVGTVMSNLGLERFVESLGLRFHRTKVGDRYISEYMEEHGGIIGGESSGHIIFKKHSTTGDGSLAALKTIEAMKYYNKSLKNLVKEIALYPQILKNVPVKSKPPLDTVKPLQDAVKKAEEKLGDRGRVLLRYSGTESLLRIMLEGEKEELINPICDELVEVVKRELR